MRSAKYPPASAHHFSEALFAEHLSASRPAQYLHEAFPALLALEGWIDLGLLRCRNINFLHIEQILVFAAQDVLDDPGSQILKHFLLLGRKFSCCHLLPHGIHSPEDIAFEVDAHGPVLIARVEGEDLLSIIHKDQIALAGCAAQERLHRIQAAGCVLGNADQLLILGAG